MLFTGRSADTAALRSLGLAGVPSCEQCGPCCEHTTVLRVMKMVLGVMMVATASPTCAFAIPRSCHPEGLIRLRGGGRKDTTLLDKGSSLLNEPSVRETLDAVLRETERGAAMLRKSLKPAGGPTTIDAVLSGAVLGVVTGKVLIGDPKLLAVTGAAAFSYAHQCPGQVPPQLRDASRRCSELAHEVRAYFTKGVA